MSCLRKIQECFIVGDTLKRAECVLDDISEIVDRYGFITVADVKECIGYKPNPGDELYGWVNVSGAEVRKKDGRYCIFLPRMLPINHTPNKRDMSPAAILDMIASMGNPEEYTYIILGKPGPNGKTWLCDRLKSRGFKAIEISEDVIKYVAYYERPGNSVTFDDFDKHVTIILNEPLHK